MYSMRIALVKFFLAHKGEIFLRKYRIGALLLVLVLAFNLLAGCSAGKIKGTGGTALSDVSLNSYDFTTSYIQGTDSCEKVLEDWRLGKLGNKSFKVISGDTAGVGVRYTCTFPDKWQFSGTVSFENAAAAAAGASIVFGDATAPALEVTLKRDAGGKVCAALLQNGETAATTDFVKTENTVFQIVLDLQSTKSAVLGVVGDTFNYWVQVEFPSALDFDSMEDIGFSADVASIAFEQIAFNVLVYTSGEFQITSMAKSAIEDLMANFWEGSPTDGHFINCLDTMVWEYGMAMLLLETMYDATGDELYKQYITSQWAHMQTLYTDRIIARAGYAPNLACDDAGWTAMTLMTIYRITGDEHALKLAGDVVRNSYAYWCDGDISKGIWYAYENGKPKQYEKSLYSAALVLSGLEYHEYTKGTDLADPDLYEDTLALYEWIETYLRRDGTKTYGDMVVTADDNLYFISFMEENDTGITYGPSGGTSPLSISQMSSCSALFGNMAMAAINAKLYKMTGENKYLTKALETANAIPDSPYNESGILLNDRDAWTDAAFMRYWVNDILTLDGVAAENLNLVKNTSLSVCLRCRTEDGYYRHEWGGKNIQTRVDPTQIMTTATSVHMIVGGALAEKLGLF